MKKIIINSKIKIDGDLNFKNLSSLNLLIPSLKNISNLKLLYKNISTNLGKLFSIKLEENFKEKNEIFIYGSNKFCNYLGYEWNRDDLLVDSEVGSFLGARMKSGRIRIEGSCENFLGAEMSGGTLIVNNNAGDFAGSAMPGNKFGMLGGEILVIGNARNYLGFLMKKGLIVVRGDVNDFCCSNMIAGTVIVSKKIGKDFGISMKRGSLIFLKKPKNMNSNFIWSGLMTKNFLNLLDNYIKLKFGISLINKKFRFSRFVGDRNNSGLGEIITNSQ
tara:strand:- start:1535 stop:2359 length:825 start_codon:yes stop_codon:yes gene_type:complete